MADPLEKLEGPSLFGRKIAEVPCMRDSFLYGISAGLGGGILYFFLSSKPRIASHISMTTFVVTTLGYWSYCRYFWEKQAQQNILLKEFIKDHHLREGIYPVEPQEKPEIFSVSNSAKIQ